MAGRTLSQEPPLKRVRKGTKSCTEFQRLNDKVGIEDNAGEALGLRATPSTDLRVRDSLDDLNQVPNETEDTSEGPTSPPPHLMQLFSNSVLGADAHSNENDSPSSARHSTGKSHTLFLLRRHLPSRDDMIKIASLASRWLAIYDSMFPMIKTPKTSEEMVSTFDRLWQEQSPAAVDSDWNPALSCASLLLAIAITAQQTSVDRKEPELQSIGDATHFVKRISDMVERLVIADDALVESLAGIEVALLWLRLQLGRAKIKKMYIVIRRIVAFAELSGLPGAPEAIESRRSGTVTGTIDRDLWHKAELWESICAVDRIMSMMWSMPL
ncbi:hypothetical protein KC343_g18440, partial [Hortaea werneckii]